MFHRLQALVALQIRAERLAFLNPKTTASSCESGRDGDLLSTFTAQGGPGQLIGRYKILEQIGEGGRGIVYVVEQEKPLRRRVALKVIKPGMGKSRCHRAP